LVGISIRPARGPSADLQDDLFELIQLGVGELGEVRFDPSGVELVPGHLDRNPTRWNLSRSLSKTEHARRAAILYRFTTAPMRRPISSLPRSGRLGRATAAAIAARSLSVAAQRSRRLRLQGRLPGLARRQPDRSQRRGLYAGGDAVQRTARNPASNRCIGRRRGQRFLDFQTPYPATHHQAPI
jgi:hypothetical protein